MPFVNLFRSDKEDANDENQEDGGYYYDDDNNNNNNNANQEAENEYYNCGWFQQGCGDDGATWWEKITGAANQGDSRTIVFTYVWALVLFLLVLHYGAKGALNPRHGRPTCSLCQLGFAFCPLPTWTRGYWN